MSTKRSGDSNVQFNSIREEDVQTDLRRGPWTREEDNLLIQYIARHGEGRWNLLAKCAGLKRTGKSCRLRWLNYLKPNVKRGNLTPQEQLLILELHHKWGNRWSKIAQHLPGRTDNEIKNYWRTRVQKQARQLNIEPNSKTFIDTVRYYWMPRMSEKMNNSSQDSPSLCPAGSVPSDPSTWISPKIYDKAIDYEDVSTTYYCSNYYDTTSSSATSPIVPSPPQPMEVSYDQAPQVLPQGLNVTSGVSHNVGGERTQYSYYPNNLDDTCYFMDNTPSFDVDGLPATSAADAGDSLPLGFCHVDDQESNYFVGNEIGDGFWTTMDGIW